MRLPVQALLLLSITLGCVACNGSPKPKLTSLAWQNLPISGAGSNAIPADFDADGEDELLGFDDDWRAILYELSGKSTPLTGEFCAGASQPGRAWDVNGDGRAEILGPTMDENHFRVLDTSGNLILDIRGYEHTGRAADLDGDGFKDLLVVPANGVVAIGNKQGIKHIAAMGKGGKVIWKFTSAVPFTQSFVTGDVDGDGKSELVAREPLQYGGGGANSQPYLIRFSGKTESLNIRAGLIPPFPSLCSDLDGDGADEIIFGDLGYLNYKTGTYTKFPGGKQSYDAQLTVDVDGNGAKDIVSLSAFPAKIRARNAKGDLILEQDLKVSSIELDLVQAKSGDRIVMATKSKWLIFP